MLPLQAEALKVIEEFVRRQLKQLRTNTAIGLDNTSARLLKDSASVISKVSQNCLIDHWSLVLSLPYGRLERYLPSLKKGGHCDPNNYRPITVLLTLNKFLEKAVPTLLFSQ